MAKQTNGSRAPHVAAPPTVATLPKPAGPTPPLAKLYGSPVPTPTAPHDPAVTSEQSYLATFLFAVFLGPLGADRFYTRHIGLGVLKLVTAGGLGLWSLIDVLLLLFGVRRDARGRYLEGEAENKKLSIGIVVFLLLIGLIVALLVRY